MHGILTLGLILAFDFWGRLPKEVNRNPIGPHFSASLHIEKEKATEAAMKRKRIVQPRRDQESLN